MNWLLIRTNRNGDLEAYLMENAITRRSILGAGPGLIGAQIATFNVAWSRQPDSDVTFVNDFDELWRTLSERYCFFGEKQTDWRAVRRLYRPQAQAATSSADFASVIRKVTNELYDAHTYLRESSTDGPRGPYFDMWVEPNRDGTAVITSVRDGSAAADVGVVRNETILAVDDVPVGKIAAEFMPNCLFRPDPAALAHALNSAVSGRIAQPRTLSLRTASGETRKVLIPVKTRPELPDVESRMLSGQIGYIVIRSFADDAVVAAVDDALLALHDTQGLIIDVRQNGGGDTAVARPIMGRFISDAKPYARMRRRQGNGLSAPWTETVEPRGPFTYRAPVAILTSRWSASMAEGFPMGMRGIGRGTIVGTPMMRLGAAVFQMRLDRTGLQLQYSAEPVYDVQDGPRWRLEPDILVEGGEDVLTVAVANLTRANLSRP
jgi:carboxyl-terminal processing protease